MIKTPGRSTSLASSGLLLISCGSGEAAMPETDFEEALPEKLIQAKPGDVINIPARGHQISRRLSLHVSGAAIGASDAGIYGGQCSQIVVHNSRAEFNVAGIEIENSPFADVHGNSASTNSE